MYIVTQENFIDTEKDLNLHIERATEYLEKRTRNE